MNTYYFANEYVLLCQRIRITLPTNTYYFAIEYVLLFCSSIYKKWLKPREKFQP